ncbi:hypothetical protein K4U34_08090 [Staphylococcus epidermidis]|uniref:hypothetical protein n=1 Tax=Staphylococcus epidermidis TaxID=1282 RepID=UPI00098BAECA|nr:hypothetical protein [Staphylococcus epidermidis]KAB2175257.1 hypothetical protein F9B30_05940 [Staphylococcus epidermidis]MCG1598681.1 hypothetical protein [Staphylococcus epidermidis]MCG1609739.1 hypothetical protein [Staphylococcus epidermidis]MCG1625437.1 hypothetical protein [Staphylococcus epidermidis]MCG2251637.1 hypothetical protein [Staphylococcus epidermidis]
MLTLSKGIEPGDWLSFWGTLFGALIGAVIAGGIAIYVAHRQNKQQNDYIEKQNELDKRVKNYEMISYLVNNSIKTLNNRFETLSKIYFEIIDENDKAIQRKLLNSMLSYVGSFNNEMLTFSEFLNYYLDSNDAELLKKANEKLLNEIKKLGSRLSYIAESLEDRKVKKNDIIMINEVIGNISFFKYGVNKELQKILFNQFNNTYK